jgi:hypothetical protein
MTTALIIGGVLLLGMGMVASELFKLKDWLKKQPAVPNPEPDAGSDAAPDPSASSDASIPDATDPPATV